jgi:hypothetical protein
MEDFIMSYAYRSTKPANEPLSAEKIAADLQKCVDLQAKMKDVNAYYRKHGTCKGYPDMSDDAAAKLDKQATVRSWETQPYPSCTLTNNNSQIKRLESKLSEASRGFSGWEFEGGRAEANTDMNRLQLFFDGKPPEEQRAQLKSNGFKWAPSQDAWQRQLNDNAIYAAGRMDFIKPTDGRTVREHQPKPAPRDTGAR